MAAPGPYPVCHGAAEDHLLNFPAVSAGTESAGSHIHSHGESQAPPVPDHPVNAGHVRCTEGHTGVTLPGTACPPLPTMGPPRRTGPGGTPSAHCTQASPSPPQVARQEKALRDHFGLQLCSLSKDPWCYWSTENSILFKMLESQGEESPATRRR